jgi:hypothetical protein
MGKFLDFFKAKAPEQESSEDWKVVLAVCDSLLNKPDEWKNFGTSQVHKSSSMVVSRTPGFCNISINGKSYNTKQSARVLATLDILREKQSKAKIDKFLKGS